MLEAGEPLVLFPEGERKSGPVVQPMFDGAAYVALRAGVPIVPVGIGGSERVMPKGAKVIYPRKVRVIVGEPLTLPAHGSGRVPRSQTQEMSALLHERLQQLFDEASRDVLSPRNGVSGRAIRGPSGRCDVESPSHRRHHHRRALGDVSHVYS